MNLCKFKEGKLPNPNLWISPQLLFSYPFSKKDKKWEFKYDKLKELKQKLNETKHQIDEIKQNSIGLYEKIVAYMYPLEDLRMSRGLLISMYNAEAATNAWAKLYELLSKFMTPYMENKIQKNDLTFSSFHTAEAPGTFMFALNHFIKTKFPNIKWSWCAETYIETNTIQDSQYLGDDFGLMKRFPQNWYYGSLHNGDLTDAENLRSFRHHILELTNTSNETDGVDFYTADGLVPISNFDNEDIQNMKLYLAEVVCALMTLKKGGIMVVKTFDHFEASAIAILYLASCAFDEFYITKPQASKPANSESYIVGIGYNNIYEEHFEKILSILENMRETNQHISFFRQDDIPDEFIDNVIDWETKITKIQIETINDTIEKCVKYKNNPLRVQAIYADMRHEKSLEWIKSVKLKVLDDNDKLMEIQQNNKDKGGGNKDKLVDLFINKSTDLSIDKFAESAKSINQESIELRSYWNEISLEDGKIPKGFIDSFIKWANRIYIETNVRKPFADKLLSYFNQNMNNDEKGKKHLSHFIKHSVEFKQNYISWCHPHIDQVFQDEQYSYNKDLQFTRILNKEMPELEYRRRKGEIKSTIHWGQRKLLMSEIEFLTLSIEPETQYLVAYAGAAPGTHISLLAELFPDITWFLVDPAPFTCTSTDKIIIRQELFTTEICNEVLKLAKKKNMEYLLISDIRTADFEIDAKDIIEQKVKSDMNMQLEWYYHINPLMTMFKFRLPWYAGFTKYVLGDIYLPIWGPITTTETRLIIKRDAKTIRYDNKKYESQMFYFNTTLRPSVFTHYDIEYNNVCYDNCYDCMAEIDVLTKYLDKFKFKIKDVYEFSKLISNKIARDRDLCDSNVDPELRKKIIKKRQYIEGKPAVAMLNKKEI